MLWPIHSKLIEHFSSNSEGKFFITLSASASTLDLSEFNVISLLIEDESISSISGLLKNFIDFINLYERLCHSVNESIFGER